ncbi:unnamed protein product [Vicia faba]|uniref:RRM domain-containing protein n=1 Tax=Vicia faba TaxID=3906 RepID=A0AAV0ZC39_VICFA|nr:unnamed protein product [Vicia faba]
MSELTTELANTNITTTQENDDAATKVHVGGIPYYSSENGIHSYFESCGTITEINCMTFHDTGKFRGYAHVDLSDSKKPVAGGKSIAGDKFVAVDESIVEKPITVVASGKKKNRMCEPVTEGLEVMPVTCFKNVMAENLKLHTRKEEMDVDMSFALQGKKKLMKEVKLKNQLLEKHGLLERSKRPRVEGSDTTIRQVEELQAKHQEIENLRLSKRELEAKYCEEVANKDKGPAEEAKVGNIDYEDWELKYHCLLALVKKRGFVTGDPFSGND